MNKLMTPEIIKKRILENRTKKATEDAKRKKEIIDSMISSCDDKFISRICELFINRWDCYAIQDIKNPLSFPTVYQNLTIDTIKKSIKEDSDITIGIHQIDNNKIKWLCYDIDKKHTPNPRLLVDQIVKYLKEWYNLHGHIEPSGSIDSYHVWIFTEPTDVNIAINFHKEFKNRLKLENIDIKPIEKGISKGNKGLGCMIKLPFNIQKKNNKRSELLSDIFDIVPEKIPIIQEQKIQTIQTASNPTIQTTSNPIMQRISNPTIETIGHTVQSNIWKYDGAWVCSNTAESVKYDAFENVEMCSEIISKIPKIANRLKLPESDRSGLDFVIIKILSEVGISKDTIYKYLKTVPNSKIHERGDSYFQKSYDNVIKRL